MNCICKSNYLIQYKIILLDQSELLNEVFSNETGQEILNYVFDKLNLVETTYFGLRFIDCENQTHWLDEYKKIKLQLKSPNKCHVLYFGVKFYATDPCKLIEEITRYQFFLQVKLDILHGRLPVSYDLAVELGSFIVQSELGDYDPHRHFTGYISDVQIISNQTIDFESRVEEFHKNLKGQLPSVSEMNFLDKVKWLEMYGVDLHTVVGEDDVEYFIGLTPSGVIVIRNKAVIANYFWSRIVKIYHKNRFFMIKIRDTNNTQNTFGFEIPSKASCKHLWKCCKEHQKFFRLFLHQQNPKPNLYTFKSKNDFTYEKVSLKRSENYQSINNKSHMQSIGNNNYDKNLRSYSPLSIYSAPWDYMRKNHYIQSPKSLRSIRTRYQRSFSLDSQSSNELKNYKKRQRFLSDNEAELRNHRTKLKYNNRKKSPTITNRMDKNDINQDKQQSQKMNGIYSGIETESEISYRHQRNRRKRRRHRKHMSRSRSKSPRDRQYKLSCDIKDHLNYDLIDTTGMSENQLKEIPYTVIHTNQAKQLKLKKTPYSNSFDKSPKIGNGYTHSSNNINTLDNTSNKIAMYPNKNSQNLNKLFDSLSMYENRINQNSNNRAIGSTLYRNPNTIFTNSKYSNHTKLTNDDYAMYFKE